MGFNFLCDSASTLSAKGTTNADMECNQLNYYSPQTIEHDPTKSITKKNTSNNTTKPSPHGCSGGAAIPVIPCISPSTKLAIDFLFNQ